MSGGREDAELNERDSPSFGEDVQTITLDSVETQTETGHDSAMAIDQHHASEQVKIDVNVVMEETIETDEPANWTMVDASEESIMDWQPDSTVVDLSRESSSSIVNVHNEGSNLIGELASEQYNGALDTIVREADKTTTAGAGASNRTACGPPTDPGNESVHRSSDSECVADVSAELTAVKLVDTTTLDPTAHAVGVVDLDIPGAERRANLAARWGGSEEAENALKMINQHQIHQHPGDLKMSWTGLTGGRQGWNSKLSAGLDPTALLEGWDWVFQRK